MQAPIDEAKERAALYFPPPKYAPLTAGLFGFAGSGMVLAMFLGFAGIDSDSVGFPVVITTGLAFGVPYLVVRNQEKRYWKHVATELRQLQEKPDATRT
jgi:hypothetical protein